MKKLFFLTLILFLTAGFFPSCKKDKGDPPALPPRESMTIDFSNFAEAKKSSGFIIGQKGTDDSNFQFAATVAGIWNLIINSTLIVPVTAFKLAVDQDPVYLDVKTWQWSYNVLAANITYKARLVGQIRTSDVLWKMYITKEGSYTDFLWFEGTSKLDGTGGQWILNQSYQAQDALLQIDWTKPGASIGSIKYTFLKNADSFKNSYIIYELTTGLLNAKYTIHYYNSTLLKFSEMNVEWSTTVHNGRVKCTDYLGDDSWYCWNENKINILCP